MMPNNNPSDLANSLISFKICNHQHYNAHISTMDYHIFVSRAKSDKEIITVGHGFHREVKYATHNPAMVLAESKLVCVDCSVREDRLPINYLNYQGMYKLERSLQPEECIRRRVRHSCRVPVVAMLGSLLSLSIISNPIHITHQKKSLNQ